MFQLNHELRSALMSIALKKVIIFSVVPFFLIGCGHTSHTTILTTNNSTTLSNAMTAAAQTTNSNTSFSCVITKVTEPVTVLKANSDVWTEAKMGMYLQVKDRLKTGAAGFAQITFFKVVPLNRKKAPNLVWLN